MKKIIGNNVVRILFDFRIYQYAYNRGIGRYIYDLVRYILKNDKNNELETSIFLKREIQNFPEFDEKYNIKFYFYEDLDKYNFKEKFDFWFFDDFMVAQKMGDVNCFFDNLFPEKLRNNSKKIVGIAYDLIPVVFSKEYFLNKIFKTKYILLLETLKVVDHLFAISDFTKNEYIKHLKIDEYKITNIYGSSDLEKFRSKNSNKEYFSKDRTNNIICVPANDKRKNAQGLIGGFSIAYNSGKIPKDSKLYICCYMHDEFQKMLEEIIIESRLTNNEVIITGFISDVRLINLISNAKATVFPSFYEGLGLPIIESYACGTPSFASNRSSTKELVLPECGFNPYDNRDIADKIIKAYNDEELCKKSLEFGRKLIREKFNWDVISNAVIDKLKELIR